MEKEKLGIAINQKVKEYDEGLITYGELFDGIILLIIKNPDSFIEYLIMIM